MGSCMKSEFGIEQDPEGYHLDHYKIRENIMKMKAIWINRMAEREKRLREIRLRLSIRESLEMSNNQYEAENTNIDYSGRKTFMKEGDNLIKLEETFETPCKKEKENIYMHEEDYHINTDYIEDYEDASKMYEESSNNVSPVKRVKQSLRAESKKTIQNYN